MKRFLGLAALLVLAGAVLAHEIDEVAFTCPLSDETFSSLALGFYSTGGGTDELRAISYFAPEEYWVHTCPASYYSGFAEDFEGAQDEPTRQELEAIGRMLAERRKQPLPPACAMFHLEKIALAEACYSLRKLPPTKRMLLYLTGAWLADDAGQDAAAVTYRRKALPELIRVAKGPDGDPATWVARYRVAALHRTLGDEGDAELVLAKLQEDANRKLRQFEAMLAETDEQDAHERERLEALLGTLQGLTARIALDQAKLAQVRAGPTTGQQKARGGGFMDRRAFVRVHAGRQDPQTRAFVQTLLDDPRATKRDLRTYSQSLLENYDLDDAEDRREWAREILLDDLWDAYGLDNLFVGRDEPIKTPDEFSRMLMELKDVEAPDQPMVDWLFPVTERKDDDAPAFVSDDEGPTVGVWTEMEILVCLTAMKDAKALGALQQDFARRPFRYLQLRNFGFGWFHEDWHGFSEIDAALARDEAGAVAVARAAQARLETGQVKPLAFAATLFPLALCTGEASLEMLAQAASHKADDVRLATGLCLLRRGEALGKDVLVAESLEREQAARLQPGLARALITLLTADDLPKLQSLAKEDPPLWALAGIARLDPDTGAAAYEKAAGLDEAIARSQARTTQPAWRTFEAWDKAHNVYDVARAGKIHCTVRMADLLLGEARYQRDPYELARVIRALDTCPQRREQLRKLILDLTERLTPLPVKLAILDAAGIAELPKLQPVIETWSRSRNQTLATAAAPVLNQARGSAAGRP